MGVSKTKLTKTKWGSKNVERKWGANMWSKKGEQNWGAKLGARIGAKPQTRTSPNIVPPSKVRVQNKTFPGSRG